MIILYKLPQKLESIINQHAVEKTDNPSGISEGDLIQGTGYSFVAKGGGAKQEGAVLGDKYLQK